VYRNAAILTAKQNARTVCRGVGMTASAVLMWHESTGKALEKPLEI
jgi:hypothetical protein